MHRWIRIVLAAAIVIFCVEVPSRAASFMPMYVSGGGGSNPITVSCTQTRSSGAPPLTVFFDCTGTTSSSYVASGKEFTQIYGICDFGDTGSSGSGNWSYGADGWGKAKNSASGLICAHTYADAGSYSPTFTAYVIDTGSGALYTSSVHTFTSISVSNPDTAYSGTATICVSASGTFTNCPAGAQQATQSNYGTALASYLANNTRVLFHCGETFTGNGASVGGSGWRIGAYGACVGTTANRPIWQQSGASDALDLADSVSDVAISDVYVDGSTFEPGGFIANESTTNPLQLTFYNVAMHAMGTNFWTYGARQYALVASTADSMKSDGSLIGTFVNTDEWNSGYSYDYSAVIGNSLDGNGGGGGAGQEVLRISACNKCIFTNNDIKNANTVGATMKFHAGNTNNSCNTWAGFYSENTEISDNHFSGTSGANLVEVAPQNGQGPGTYSCGAEAGYMDERLRLIVIERNFFESVNAGGRELTISGQDMAVRNNVFSVAANDWGLQLMQRSDIAAWPTINNEIYSNTCFSTSAHTTQACVEIGNTGGTGTTTPASNTLRNNLGYLTSVGAVMIDDNDANTKSNNTATVSNNPSFVNGGGSMSLFSDFKPTANYSGGAAVPAEPYGGLGAAWSGTWDLGAIKH